MAPQYRVCFDVLGAQELAWDRGIPRFIAEHGKALLERAEEFDLTFRADPALALMPPAQQFAATGRLRRTREPPWPEDGTPSILHITSPFELQESVDRIWPRWARSDGWTTVATVWDLIPLVVPGYLPPDSMRKERYLQRLELLKSVDHLLAISQHTAADIERHLGIDSSRITVINAGVDTSRFALTDIGEARELATTGLPELRHDFVYYVGGDDPRKNMAGLIRAFARTRASRRGVQLVLGGTVSSERRPYFEDVAADAGLRPGDVLLTGHVDDRVLSALYQACTLFVFPSLYEGSGLPMLEAMAAGAPVIAASTSTGPEILGSLAGTFDPHDEGAIAAAVDWALSDDAYLRRLRERSAKRASRFTWQRVAERTTVGYETALVVDRPARRRRHPTSRRRLAIVSPLPPERSGIADYAAGLTAAMREHSERPIDLVVSDQAPVTPAPGILTESAFRAAIQVGSAYDEVLFHFGNSGFHAHMLDLLPWCASEGVPATALLHEATMSGVFTDGVRAGTLPLSRLAVAVAERYPVLKDKPREDLVSFLEQEGLTHGVLLSTVATCGATRILVHSQLSRELLLSDRGDAGGPPIHVVPFGAPAARPLITRDPNLIVSTGIVAEIKDINTLLLAFGIVRDRRPGARLVLAGSHGRPDDVERFRRTIADLDVGDAVEMPGYVSEDERWRLLGQAAVAVQLRRRSQGEASAAVMDSLAAGTPTVVTDLGWMSELPDDVVEHVQAYATPASVAEHILRVLDETSNRGAQLTASAAAYADAHAFKAVAATVLATWLR